MGHVILSMLCFVLWGLALNLVFVASVLTQKRGAGSALLFTMGVTCLVSLLALGVYAHIDIAQTWHYTGLTVISAPFLIKRVMRKIGKMPSPLQL